MPAGELAGFGLGRGWRGRLVMEHRVVIKSRLLNTFQSCHLLASLWLMQREFGGIRPWFQPTQKPTIKLVLSLTVFWLRWLREPGEQNLLHHTTGPGCIQLKGCIAVAYTCCMLKQMFKSLGQSHRRGTINLTQVLHIQSVNSFHHLYSYVLKRMLSWWGGMFGLAELHPLSQHGKSL